MFEKLPIIADSFEVIFHCSRKVGKSKFPIPSKGDLTQACIEY